jgi:hypothetical protein
MIDPFEIRKRYVKWNLRRAAYTAYSRAQDIVSRNRFGRYALPLTVNVSHDAGIDGTAVTAAQQQVLLRAIEDTEELSGTCIVEVGAYRGVTTRFLAEHTKRRVFAIDPFIGYGGNDVDLAQFHQQIEGLANVELVRTTSGGAAAYWRLPVGLAFIDSVHDFVNTRFDAAVWSKHVVPGGLIAFHDTDNPAFAGTRRAVFLASLQMPVFAHIKDMTILRKRTHEAPTYGRNALC